MAIQPNQYTPLIPADLQQHRLLTKQEVMGLMSFSVATIDRKVKAAMAGQSDFPLPIHPNRHPRWYSKQVIEWIERQAASSARGAI
jgi:predicted DNA-binding transcriptional regulator AlpA